MITENVDVARVAIYLFWAFFAGLVFYLHREDKREGYPLETDNPGEKLEGFPPMPAKKTYLTSHHAE